MSLTLDEFSNQHLALRRTFDELMARKEDLLAFYRQASPRSLSYIGCGSGYTLCRSGELSAKIHAGLPAASLAAGDLMLNAGRYEALLEGTLLVAPSRSGSTSEVIRAIDAVKALNGAPVLGISCVEQSELSRRADFTIELPWAFDHSVCQTRTVTNLYAANLLIAAFLGGNEQLVRDIDSAISLAQPFIGRLLAELPEALAGKWSNVALLADGELHGLAAEGAMAFSEIAQVHASTYHLLDVRHGPMVLVNDSTLIIAALSPGDESYQQAVIGDILGRGATVVTFSGSELQHVSGVKRHYAFEQGLDRAALGILFIMIAQMAAIAKADARGFNPDSPAGLSAWIKL